MERLESLATSLIQADGARTTASDSRKQRMAQPGDQSQSW
jgi:hypothetical protein